MSLTEFDPDLDDGAQMDYWDILSDDFRSLVKPLSDLISKLATPIWDWYGMGGDDHCYDYWPNSMTLALEYLNQLREIARSFPTPGEREDLERFVAPNLNKVYWLVRFRYSHDFEKLEGDPTPIRHMRRDADGYFESDILDHEGFGDRPSWIPDPHRGE